MGDAWRIVREKRANTAFDGEGARLHGGRWNSVGVRVVYVSRTKSLAALETLGHLPPPVTAKYVAIHLQFDDVLVKTYIIAALPAGWYAEPPSLVSRRIGDAWVKSARSPLLALPSMITGETN
jgi:RES domain-containing protein